MTGTDGTASPWSAHLTYSDALPSLHLTWREPYYYVQVTNGDSVAFPRPPRWEVAELMCDPELTLTPDQGNVSGLCLVFLSDQASLLPLRPHRAAPQAWPATSSRSPPAVTHHWASLRTASRLTCSPQGLSPTPRDTLCLWGCEPCKAELAHERVSCRAEQTQTQHTQVPRGSTSQTDTRHPDSEDQTEALCPGSEASRPLLL